MKRKWTDNIPLKIMSIVVGILVWVIVVNIDDPSVTVPFVIQDVEVINEAYVDDAGKMCMLDESENSVRVYITGGRKTINRITADNIKAVADLQQAVSLETDPVMVPITATCPGIPAGNIRVTPQNLSIHLEDKDTKEFVVNVNKGDSKPGKGYEIGSQTVSPEKVKITGPESLINKIDNINVNVNVEGMTEDTTETAALTITDKNQDVLTDVSMNYLKIDNDGRAIVTTRLWKVRTDIKISAEYKGEPAEGYIVDSLATVPETLSVAGSEEALEALTLQGNTIWIQNDDVDISGESNDVEKKLSLPDFLPENIKLTSGSSEDIWIRVNILPEGSHIYELKTSDIKVKNKAKNLQGAFAVDRLEIRVRADDGNLGTFSADSIHASIDLKNKEEGDYDVPVKITLPDGYELIDDVTAEVKISKVSSVEENNE